MKQQLLACATHVRQELETEHGLIGLSLYRVFTGLSLLWLYTVNYPIRHFLWGPQGGIPFFNYRQGVLSFLSLSESTTYFEVIYHLTLVVLFLWTIGWKTRYMQILAFALRYSFYTKNSLISHGGENINTLVHFYLLFADTGRYLSIDRLATRGQARGPSSRPWLAILQNFGIIASITQICVMYFTTGLYKVMGGVWTAGTAIYYTLQIDMYSSPISHLIYERPGLSVFLTYSTMFFEVFFAFGLILNRYSRWAALFGGLLLHVGIAVFMGLIVFSWMLLSTYFLCITTNEYLAIFRFVRGCLDKLRSRVYYDDRCKLCRRTIAISRSLDWLALLDFRSVYDERAGADTGVPLDTLLRSMHVRTERGRVLNGFDGMFALSMRLPLLWILSPIFAVGKLTGIGDFVYRKVAESRTRESCGGSCDPIPEAEKASWAAQTPATPEGQKVELEFPAGSAPGPRSWLLTWAWIATLTLVLIVHFIMVGLYVCPPNPIKMACYRAVKGYIEPVFFQDWHLFSPEPVNYNLIMLLKCRTADEGPVSFVETDWEDITTPCVEAYYGHRFSHWGSMLYMQGSTHTIRPPDTYSSEFIQLYQKKHPDSPLALGKDVFTTQRTTYADELSARVASFYAGQLYGSKGQVKEVKVRWLIQPAVGFSKSSIPPGSYAESKWMTFYPFIRP